MHPIAKHYKRRQVVGGNDDRIEYLPCNVLEAAKSRLRNIINTFDSLYVCFSGGKDSWVLLNLVDEVYREMGIRERVRVVFRDEELIQDTVLDFVNAVRLSGRFDFRYYCVPLESEKYVLGDKATYIQWYPQRQWIRPKPDYAITADVVMSQYTADAFITQDGKGRIGLLMGIRADESLTRLSGVLRKRHECYVSDSDYPHIKKLKPIYDWRETDIFKYLHERGTGYCSSYDYQMFAGMALRVSTPLHAESSKNIYQLKEAEPVFYAQVCALFPEMRLQERYFHALDRHGIIARYPRSFAGIYQYISEHITDPEQRKKARKAVYNAELARNKALKEARHNNPFGGYPILYVFRCVVNGAYKRTIMPKAFANTSNIEKAYEDLETV
jgi:3'-phosphoadenosine 5'-phosphosulfate sulfotransferase (PAPS reductase)/FAD synthetase